MYAKKSEVSFTDIVSKYTKKDINIESFNSSYTSINSISTCSSNDYFTQKVVNSPRSVCSKETYYSNTSTANLERFERYLLEKRTEERIQKRRNAYLVKTKKTRGFLSRIKNSIFSIIR